MAFDTVYIVDRLNVRIKQSVCKWLWNLRVIGDFAAIMDNYQAECKESYNTNVIVKLNVLSFKSPVSAYLN